MVHKRSGDGVLVILGSMHGKNVRAARFGPPDAATAIKAASLMGLKIGRAETAEARILAMQLPEGRIFATGKGLVPLVKLNLYHKLCQVLTPLTKPPRVNRKR